MQRHYESVAPPSLLLGSRILQLRQHVVIIAADNGAIAGKLRQMTTELISLFQARGCEVTGIQIKVQVRSAHPPVRALPRKTGPGARAALEGLGRTLSDSPLKTALMRLSRRV